MSKGKEELMQVFAKDAAEMRVNKEENNPRSEEVLKREPRKMMRLVGFLMANGQGLEEVMEKTGLTGREIQRLREDPGFKHVLVTEARKVGPNAVQQIFSGALVEAALGIINVAATGTGKVKLDACRAILDRGVGTPVGGKPLDMGEDDGLPDDVVAANKKLEQDITRLQDELGIAPAMDAKQEEV